MHRFTILPFCLVLFQRHLDQSRGTGGRSNLALLPPSAPPDGLAGGTNTSDSSHSPVTGQEMVVAMSVEAATPTDEGVFVEPADREYCRRGTFHCAPW